MLARFAFAEGTKIAWWSKALQGGTIKDLHIRASHADSFWSALFSGRQFNFVTLASIAVTIMVIDQPLIQRASSVISMPKTTPVNITALIAPEIPWGFTGFQVGRGYISDQDGDQQLMTQPLLHCGTPLNSPGTPSQSEI